MEREGYQKIFPACWMTFGLDLADEARQLGGARPGINIDNMAVYNEMNETMENFFLNLTIEGKLEEFFDDIKLYHLVSRICLLKCEILKSLGDRVNCEKWSSLHYHITYDIQSHLRILEPTGMSVENENMSRKVALHEMIAATIRLSLYSPQRRCVLFQWLLVAIMTSEKYVVES